MKKVLFIFFLLHAQLSHAQILMDSVLGTWQADNAEITSMYLDTYHFFDNGRFTFNPNEYNGLNRIVSIKGRYSLRDSTISLTPDSTMEIVGGYPVRSQMTTLSDTWEIEGGKVKTVACKKKAKQRISIKLISSQKSILLDGRKYYKIKI